VGAQRQGMDVGCAFVRVEASAAEQIPYRMVLPMWRHPGSANLMVDKDERKAMLLRLFNEKDTEIVNHVAEKARAEAAAAAAEEGGEKDEANEKEQDASLSDEEQAEEKGLIGEKQDEVDGSAMNLDVEPDA